MRKRSQRLAAQKAENIAASKVSLARKLIQLRRSLHVLNDLVRAGKVLTFTQNQHGLYLVDAIGKAKKALIKAGLSPALLANTELLTQYLRTSSTHLPAENYRSGGVGLFAESSTVKRWT